MFYTLKDGITVNTDKIELMLPVKDGPAAGKTTRIFFQSGDSDDCITAENDEAENLLAAIRKDEEERRDGDRFLRDRIRQLTEATNRLANSMPHSIRMTM